ncbi:MAG: hypothetical protein K2X93_07265 [Candidatus Obscuribacterales bacterium]|nr:hypothetical protein [Candidatus Obscuribacterales bacterium]
MISVLDVVDEPYERSELGSGVLLRACSDDLDLDVCVACGVNVQARGACLPRMPLPV